MAAEGVRRHGVAVEPKDETAQARREARWARYQAESRRTGAKVQIGVAVLWIVVAVLSWTVLDGSSLVRWFYTALAVFSIVTICVQWRVLRRPLPPSPDMQKAPGR